MATGRGRARLQITLDQGLLDEIDLVCEKAHMSRSSWIEYTLSMAIQAYGDLIEGLSGAMSQGILKDAAEGVGN